jgi:hypothetical protein
MRIVPGAVAVVAVLAAPSMAFCDDVAERMYALAPAVMRLALAVESAVRYKNAPAELSDDALLEFATRHDRTLLEPLAHYRVRAKRQGRDAVVLVCGRKEPVRLLEDAGCSAKLDRHHWRSPQALPCDFTLDADAACSSSGSTSSASR